MVELFAVNGQHRATIAQMFFRIAFAEILQLSHDDVFRWRKHNVLTCVFDHALATECPWAQLVPSRGIHASVKTSIQVDEIDWLSMELCSGLGQTDGVTNLIIT